MHCFRSAAHSVAVKFWFWSAINSPNSSQDKLLHCLDCLLRMYRSDCFQALFQMKSPSRRSWCNLIMPLKQQIKHWCEQNKSFCIQLCVANGSKGKKLHLFLLLNTSISAFNAPPSWLIIAYICMNQKGLQSFSNLFSYDQHSTNAANANTLCVNPTMRREIVATRRAGMATSIITRILPSKCEHRLIAHEGKRTLAVDW